MTLVAQGLNRQLLITGPCEKQIMHVIVYSLLHWTNSDWHDTKMAKKLFEISIPCTQWSPSGH